MNILVTGGYGLIGHNVVKRLQDMNHDVVIVDNCTRYGIIPEDEMSYLLSERTNIIGKSSPRYYYDISNPNLMKSVFEIEQPEIVMHLASFPRQRVVNSNPCWGSQTMSEGLLSLLEASKLNHVRKFVYVSSSMVYGNFKDTYFDGIDEDHECHPIGQYGIMKLSGEMLVKDYARQTNMAGVIVRPSAVYGPLDCEDRVVSKFLLTAMRGGDIHVNGAKEELDFTYIDDAVDGITNAAISDSTDNMTYNITRGSARTLLDAAELAISIAGQGTLEILDRDLSFPKRGRLSIDKARFDLGYNPTIDFEQGLKQYYDWYQQNPVLWRGSSIH